MAKPRSELYGIPDKELARICRVSVKTAQRWKAGQSVPPETAIMVVRLKWERDLSELGAEWTGWRYFGDEFYSPDGWRINRNDALIVPLKDGQISALRAEIAQLKEDAAGIEEQPLPGDIPNILTA